MAALRDTTPGTGRAVNDPSRRQLVGGAVLAVLAGGALVHGLVPFDHGGASLTTGTPDAELIDLCACCDALQDRVDALHVRPSDDMSIDQELVWEKARDVVVEPISDQQEALFERICEHRATTSQGHAARARTLLGWDKDLCRDGDHHCWSEQLVGAVVRDLVALA